MAAKIALATAGATQTMGVSPAPADGTSGRSSRTTSIAGTSLKRGTRYSESDRVIDPSLREADPLEERAAETHDRRALDLVHEVVGVDDRTAVERRDEPRDADRPVRLSC